jgi:hypothetical protein
MMLMMLYIQIAKNQINYDLMILGLSRKNTAKNSTINVPINKKV